MLPYATRPFDLCWDEQPLTGAVLITSCSQPLDVGILGCRVGDLSSRSTLTAAQEDRCVQPSMPPQEVTKRCKASGQ